MIGNNTYIYDLIFFFSRERNRIHARNTRERKRAQMDLLQQRIQDLFDEVCHTLYILFLCL